MSDHPCSCGTCTNRETNANQDSFCKISGEELGGEFEFECTGRYGCLSHPQAREYLNKEVIEELETRIKRMGSHSQTMELEDKSTVRILQNAYVTTIKLLKEGVQK